MYLDNPPYLQVALDIVKHDYFKKILSKLPDSPKLLIEAGTPLIKQFGSSIIKEIRESFPDSFIIADMKTLDVGSLEVQISKEAGANAMAVSGLAPVETIVSSIKAGQEWNLTIILDLMNITDPFNLLQRLDSHPSIILFHRGIDQEGNREHPWELIHKIHKTFPDILIAVAGGLNLQTSKKALQNGADIIVIGRAITKNENVNTKTKEFLDLL